MTQSVLAGLRGKIGVHTGAYRSVCDPIICSGINATIYDTDLAHITYAPEEDFCVQWQNRVFWQTCAAWAKPWMSEVYRKRGKLASFRRSLDHELPSVTVEFQGYAIWLYGPPRSQLTAIPVDYKICMHEDHHLALDPVCYRIDVSEAYSVAEDYDSPVEIFAKGGLQYQQHRVVVSVGDPINEATAYKGIQFSHAVYTIERPTPWPVDEDAWRFREIIMHDTHPLLSYWPRMPPSWFRSGWLAKTYTAEDGSVVSWHELRSRSEENRDQWGVDATITAGAVMVYGIPKAHITDTDYLSYICVRLNSGPCEIVDVQHAYLNAEHHDESILLWRNDMLDPYRATHISIRLVKTTSGSTTVFPFKAIHYYELQEYSSPEPPVGQLEDIIVTHDNEAIVYHPERRCVTWFLWWCTGWFDPWAWREAGPTEDKLTYRSTISSYRTTEDPSITLDFQGSAVYVYGAPRGLIESPFASQHICLNDSCHIVDVEQAYLNAPTGTIESASVETPRNDVASLNENTSQGHQGVASTNHNATTLSELHPELEPVLIWSMTGLDDKLQHTLRLALASLPSEDNAEMSIAKVVYTKVTYDEGQQRPDTPIPQPDRTYEGPLYPPHATKWAPRPPPPPPLPPPPPPAPSDPSWPLPKIPPPDSQKTPQNPPHSPDLPSLGPTQQAFWSLVLIVIFLSLTILGMLLSGYNRSEAQPFAKQHAPPPYNYQCPPNHQVPPVRPPYLQNYSTFNGASNQSH
ncbi:hypothetical protein CTheo_8681 [Ceratobasidium theobromae]|uniref:Transmembrane protein n=1 Tax=Ceratobasidium theobromae TaxID=1582974 RepID=A0A5N5Q8X6_9AGAM|nr:hypothetical protein CTheo_8681 [Ceratobasidium theobromae]